MNTNVKKMVMTAMLSATALAMVVLIRIPIVLFLSYEPKDVIITIGGFLFGPFMALFVSLITSFLELVTISTTGIIGLIMNVLATCSFACPAAYIYKKDHTMKGAVIGLVSGSLLMIAIMLLWNYLITPIYMGIPRAEVVKILVPAILPFNVLKAGLNSAFILLLYKPIVTALRKIHLVESSTGKNKTNKIGYSIIAVLLLITFGLYACVLKGLI